MLVRAATLSSGAGVSTGVATLRLRASVRCLARSRVRVDDNALQIGTRVRGTQVPRVPEQPNEGVLDQVFGVGGTEQQGKPAQLRILILVQQA